MEFETIYIIIRDCTRVGAFPLAFCVPNSVALASRRVLGHSLVPIRGEGRGGEGTGGDGRGGEGTGGDGRGGEGRGGEGTVHTFPHFPQTRTFVTAEPSRSPVSRVAG